MNVVSSWLVLAEAMLTMRTDAGRPHDLDGAKEAAPGHRGSDALYKIEVLEAAVPRSDNAEEAEVQQHDAVEEVVEDKDENSHSNDGVGEAAAQGLLEVHRDILILRCHYRSPGTIRGHHE